MAMLSLIKSRIFNPRVLSSLLLSVFLSVSAYGQDAAEEEKNVDPWEGLNRSVFVFNETLDRWVLKPVATAYQFVTPNFIETGISNFFSNLLELRNILNDVLQWKWKQAGNDTGRFLVNSTAGIGGFIDVAQHVNLEKSEGEDFGQTLAVWGVPDGPFIMLPFLGPSTLRDTAGLPLDWVADPIGQLDDIPTRNSVRALDFIDTRVGLLEAEALISGDRYIFFREGYLQRRDYLVNDGQIESDFGSDFGDEEYGEVEF
ncbi:VacJ family lipoprotein [Aurantivibrio infirmus]